MQRPLVSGKPSAENWIWTGAKIMFRRWKDVIGLWLWFESCREPMDVFQGFWNGERWLQLLCGWKASKRKKLGANRLARRKQCTTQVRTGWWVMVASREMMRHVLLLDASRAHFDNEFCEGMEGLKLILNIWTWCDR